MESLVISSGSARRCSPKAKLVDVAAADVDVAAVKVAVGNVGADVDDLHIETSNVEEYYSDNYYESSLCDGGVRVDHLADMQDSGKNWSLNICAQYYPPGLCSPICHNPPSKQFQNHKRARQDQEFVEESILSLEERGCVREVSDCEICSPLV